MGRLKQSLTEKKSCFLSYSLSHFLSACLPPSPPPSFLLMHIKGTVGGTVWVMHPVYKVTNQQQKLHYFLQIWKSHCCFATYTQSLYLLIDADTVTQLGIAMISVNPWKSEPNAIQCYNYSLLNDFLPFPKEVIDLLAKTGSTSVLKYRL